MKRFNKISALILASLLVCQSSFAAWPSASARTKTWGAEVLTASDIHGQFDIIHTYINAMMNGSTGHGHTGSTNDGPKLNIATALTIASQAQGDIIYASSGSAWARLGAGTSGQFLKTQGAAANPIWASSNTANQYRREMNVMQASTTTITVGPGEVEVNGSIVQKTTNTTLTLTTTGDWATNSINQQAVSTTGYIGIDASGNLKLQTTAPTHGDYALTLTAANTTKRYVSWTPGGVATTYRVIGWFRMNATGSGQLDTYGVSNLNDMSVTNTIYYEDAAQVTCNTTVPDDNTIPQNTEGNQVQSFVFVPTNANDLISFEANIQVGNSANQTVVASLYNGAGANAVKSVYMGKSTSSTGNITIPLRYTFKAAGITAITLAVRVGGSGTVYYNGDATGTAKMGGVMLSDTRITELKSQIT